MAFPADITGQQGFSDTGDGIATWLVGTPGFARITTQNFISSYRDAYSFFVQDDWQLTPALKRQIATGSYDPRRPLVVPVREDMRYRSWKDVPVPVANAAIFYLMGWSAAG